MAFGQKFRQMRLRLGLSLREFCLKHGLDASNMSKLERGRLAPPKKRKILEHYAECLGLEPGTDDWYEFFDLAATEAGRIPEDILGDEELLKKVPVLLRAARGQEVSKADMQQLLDDLRKA